MLRFVYTFFVGILIVAFIGLGIDAFYQGPVRPDYPTELGKPYPVERVGEPTEEEIDEHNKQYEEYEQTQQNYQIQRQTYERNVSIISILSAIMILALSLIFAPKLELISDGLILGGVFTLAYGIIRGFGAEDSIFRFITVTVGLITAFILGYTQFIKKTPEAPSPTNSSRNAD